MNLIVFQRLCLKCARTNGPESEHCPQCGSPLVSAVVKLLTVNDKPVPETKETSRPNEIAWPLESVIVRIERILKEGNGRKVCHCGEPIRKENFRMYPHEGGTLVEGRGRQWFYIHCDSCGYDWSLWKLGIQFENENPVPASPKPFSNPNVIPSG